jgi:UrcA family protein
MRFAPCAAANRLVHVIRRPGWPVRRRVAAVVEPPSGLIDAGANRSESLGRKNSGSGKRAAAHTLKTGNATMNRFVFAAAAAALSTAALFAAPQAFANDVKLSWADLDLSTPEGQKALNARIDRVANTMCANQIETGTRMGPLHCRTELKASLSAEVAAKEGHNRMALRN